MYKLTLSVLVCIIFTYNTPAPAMETITDQIIVYFADSTVTFPDGLSETIVADVTFDPLEIKDTLLSYSASIMIKVYPDFNPADSIIQSPIHPELSVRRMPLDRIYFITLTEPENRDALNVALRGFDRIIFSYNNDGAGEFCIIPNDAEFYRQWGMHNTGQTGGVPDADIDCPEAWDIEQGSANTMIGIIDTGVNLSHPDLYNRITGDYPSLDDIHGTHVAGIVGAKTNTNEYGVAGVNWHAHMYSRKILDFTDPDLYSAIHTCIDQGAAVINNSWLVRRDLNYYVLLRVAIAEALNLGIPMVFARGNEFNDDAIYPACLGPYILSVGAFNQWDEKSYFSSYGLGMDVLGPGGTHLFPWYYDQEDIYSTTWGQSGSFNYMAGTSMATPHVTGIASLLHDHNNELYGSVIHDIINTSAVDMGYPGYDEQTGWGRSNAHHALKMISPPNVVYNNVHAVGGSGPYEAGSELLESPIRIYDDPWNGVELCAMMREIRYDVVFGEDNLPGSFSVAPLVIGVNELTDGIYVESTDTLVFGVRYCEVVPGTTTPTGAILRTWALTVGYLFGDCLPIIWYPETLQNIDFYYTVIDYEIEPPAPPTGLSVVSTGAPDYHPRLDWDHNSEPDLAGYKIYRRAVSFEPNWVVAGETEVGVNYFIDTDYCTPHPGYFGAVSDGLYKVTAIDNRENESDPSSVENISLVKPQSPDPNQHRLDTESEPLPTVTELIGNNPNPFNSRTLIKFNLAEPCETSLRIYNIQGQLVETVVEQYLQPGRYSFTWDASNVSSGMYLMKFSAGNTITTRRLSLLK